MINFKMRLGKWLDLRGEELKGFELLIVLLFLAFVITLFARLLETVDLPRVQVLI